jgi:hypothetical protein
LPTVTHEGVPGDADLELATLTLLFEEAIGDPLTTAEASTLAESVNVYRDDGSDVFERGSDTLVTIVSLALTDGLQVIPFANGDPDARVAQGAKVTFFVTVDSRAGASAASPRTMRIFHSVAASTAEHASTASALHQAHGRSAGAGPVVALNALLDEDSDGISNGDEVNVYGTDPLLADTDGDGLSDGAELTHGANPLLVDTDGDTLSDGWEIVLGTDPTLTDTDGDGLADNIERGLHGTDPLLTDTDGDGLSDPAELANPDTDPLLADTDGDTILDGAEVAGGTNPSLADTDADGVDDPSDNCPSAYNRDQSDDGGLDSILPDGVGNLCQNADFNGDGVVDILDVILLRRGLAELEPTLDPSMPPSP